MKGEMSVASTRRPSSARTVTASGTATTSSLPSPGTCRAHALELRVIQSGRYRPGLGLLWLPVTSQAPASYKCGMCLEWIEKQPYIKCEELAEHHTRLLNGAQHS